METEVLGGKPSLLQRVGHFANSLKKIFTLISRKKLMETEVLGGKPSNYFTKKIGLKFFRKVK